MHRRHWDRRLRVNKHLAKKARAGFPARDAAVPGDGHGLRVRVVPAAPGRQRGPPSPRDRRARRRRTRRGRGRGRRRVQPVVVRARRPVYAVRQTKPTARRTRVSLSSVKIYYRCVFFFFCVLVHFWRLRSLRAECDFLHYEYRNILDVRLTLGFFFVFLVRRTDEK